MLLSFRKCFYVSATEVIFQNYKIFAFYAYISLFNFHLLDWHLKAYLESTELGQSLYLNIVIVSEPTSAKNNYSVYPEIIFSIAV